MSSALILLSTDAFSCKSNFDEEDIQEVVRIGETTKDEIGIINQFRQITKVEEERKQITVYVSVFAESWITAVCLYDQPNIKLTLFVMPFFHKSPCLVNMDFLDKQERLFDNFKTKRMIETDEKIKLDLSKIVQHIQTNANEKLCYETDLPLYPLITNFISKNEPMILDKKPFFAIYRIVYQNEKVPKLQTLKSVIKIGLIYESNHGVLTQQDQATARTKRSQFYPEFYGINFPDKRPYVYKGLPSKAKEDGMCGPTPQQRSWWQSATASAPKRSWVPFSLTPAAKGAPPVAPKRTWRSMFGMGGRSRRKSQRQKRSKRARKSRAN
jgi:hypothetical protein